MKSEITIERLFMETVSQTHWTSVKALWSKDEMQLQNRKISSKSTSIKICYGKV
jgi:hypothetical protein